MLFVLWFTDSDYLFGICWSLCCLSFDIRILITSLVSFGHYVVCPLIYSFWLPLWYLLVIMLFVLWFTDSDYLFGIFWSLCCLSFDLQILITSLVSVGHYVVCPSIYVFWLPLWYLLVIMLFVFIYSFWLPLWYLLVIILFVFWFTDSDYLFGFFWSLCCLSFDLRILITSLVSVGHYIVCPSIYSFWLPLWYLLVIMLFVLWFTYSDYLFGFFWSLCCLSFNLQLLITSLVFFGHYVVCPLIYRFWLPLWYLLVIMLFVLWFTDSDYLFGICWSLYCLSFDLQILITSLVSFGHYVVCLWFTDSDYLFGIFWSLCCLSFDLRILITSLVQLLITSLVSFGHYVVCPLIYRFWLPLWYLLVIMLFVLWFTDSDYLFGIFWSLCCLSFDLGIMITSLVSFGHYVVCRLRILYLLVITSLVSFGHYVVCPLIYSFWLPLWFLLVIMLFVLWFTDSDYLFGIFWSLCCLSFDLQILITSLVSFGHYVVCPLIYSILITSLVSFGHYLVIMLFVIMLFVLWFTDSDYLFGIFWSLCCLSFDLQILITSLVSFGHYVVCPLIYSILITSLVIFWSLCCLSFDLPLWYLLVIILFVFDYSFWLPLWYLLVIMLFVLWFTYSDYLFGFFWSLCCLSFNLQLLITSLVFFGHYVVCPLIYSFWLPLWYLLVIILFVLWFTDSDYLFGFFWSLCCLSFDLQILITSLVSFGHYVVCPLIYVFTLCCLSFNLQLLITSLVSFGHYVVCPLIYVLWLPLWYLLVIMLFVVWFTYSDYLFGFFWSLCCLSFNLQILITSLVSFGHYVVCPLI